jgi:hypothetical protein
MWEGPHEGDHLRDWQNSFLASHGVENGDDCYPTSPQPTAAQIVDVGIRHLRKAIAEFPDQRDFFRQTPVVSLLLSAFKAAWPCPSPGR